MYLMGRIDDTYEDGMYPLVKVSEITKEDLSRCRRNEIIIYDLIEGKFFDYVNNYWSKIPSYTHYKDQWDKSD